MSRWARLRTLSSSATARRYCSRWSLARSSDSASACCRRSSSTGWDAGSGGTLVGSAPVEAGPPRADSFAVISMVSKNNRDSAPCSPVHPGWGSAARIQGGAEQFSGDVDDRDDPFIGHAGGSDDSEHPNHTVAVGVGRRHHTAVIEDAVSGLVADEDLHPFGLETLIEQVQEIALLVEGLEQAPQLLDARELGDAHEVGLALDDILELVLARDLEDLLGDCDRIQHDLVHVGACLGKLAQQLLAHLAERAAAKLLVQVVRGTLEIIGRVVPLELDDAVLHLAVVKDEHDQYAVLREPDELHLRHGRLPGARQGDDAGELRGGGQQLRHSGDELGGALAARLELAADLGARRLIERAQLQQRVDEEAVALVGGYPAGGGVR